MVEFIMKIDVNMRTIAKKRRNKYETKLSMPHAFERLDQASEIAGKVLI